MTKVRRLSPRHLRESYSFTFYRSSCYSFLRDLFSLSCIGWITFSSVSTLGIKSLKNDNDYHYLSKMPAINLRKKLYDELVRRGKDPIKVANDLVEMYLEENKNNSETSHN